MAVAILVVEEREERRGPHAAIPNLKILEIDFGRSSFARHGDRRIHRPCRFGISFQQALEALSHPRPGDGWMTMVRGIARNCARALVKLLDDAGPELGHLPRHVQNHLASLFGSNAHPIVLSPRPHIFNKGSIWPASHRGLSPVGAEIRHSVIAGIPLPGHPAKAVSIRS